MGKKESFWKRNKNIFTILSIIAFVIFAIFLIGLIGYTSQEFEMQFCDDCLHVPLDNWNIKFESWRKYRDICGNLCTCEEKRNITYISCSDPTDIGEIKEFCIKSHPKTECEKGNEEYVLDCRDGCTELTQCGCENPICRKKTHCELNNPDFIEIETCNEYGGQSWEGCWNEEEQMYMCGGGCYNCSSECIDKGLICRKKIEVEKLMDKSCNELFNSLVERKCNFDMLFSTQCSDLRTAWNKKGCEI